MRNPGRLVAVAALAWVACAHQAPPPPAKAEATPPPAERAERPDDMAIEGTLGTLSEAEFTYPIEFRGKHAVTTWEGGRVEPSLVRHKRDLDLCKAKLVTGLPPSLTLTLYV